jgi:hypothetical protein
MRRLGRLGLLAQCLRRVLVNLKRQPAGLYAALEPAADSVPGEVVAPVTGPAPAAGLSLPHFQMSPAGLVPRGSAAGHELPQAPL